MSLSFIPIVSSNLREIAYDPRSQELYIRFINDALYRYDGVPVETYLQFLRADSYGKFFHKYMKDFFPTTKIDALPQPRILIVVDAGVAEVIGTTTDCNVIIIDHDVQNAEAAYTMQAISDEELDRLLRLEQNDFPSEEE